MKTILPALRMFTVLTLLTGIIYPLAVTGVARLLFPRQAQGSLIARDGELAGSELIAQSFTNAAYFWPRPSAGDFATVPSGASNKSPASADLKHAIEARAAQWRAAQHLPADAPVPADLLLASASGLDPHISPEAARFQINRVAAARHFTPEQQQRLAALVDRSVELPQLGFLGEPRVNVLKLNLAVDSLR